MLNKNSFGCFSLYNVYMKIFITGDFIKLGQLLKKIGIISTGGTAKWYVENNSIKLMEIYQVVGMQKLK